MGPFRVRARGDAVVTRVVVSAADAALAAAREPPRVLFDSLSSLSWVEHAVEHEGRVAVGTT